MVSFSIVSYEELMEHLNIQDILKTESGYVCFSNLGFPKGFYFVFTLDVMMTLYSAGWIFEKNILL